MQLFKPETNMKKFYTCQPQGLSHFTHTIRNNAMRFVFGGNINMYSNILQPLSLQILLLFFYSLAVHFAQRGFN